MGHRQFAAGLAACLLLSVQANAQKDHPDPLTPAQIEEIREAGIDPDGRILLYAKYVGEHLTEINRLVKRARSAARSSRLDGELQNVTELTDELGANLDQYGSRKADIRKALKKVNEEAPRWLTTLRGLPSDPDYELSRKEAIESDNDLAKQAAQLLGEQTEYFKEHKDQRGQERAEPN